MTVICGKDIDQKIVNRFAETFQKEQELIFEKDAFALQRVWTKLLKKQKSSSQLQQLPKSIFHLSPQTRLVQSISRQHDRKARRTHRSLSTSAMMITKRAMEASPFKVGEINEVILVGG